MTDFLLELRSEEIPARMQARAREDLAKLFAAELAKSGLTATETVTYATPRRLALIARGLPDAAQAVSEELKGPKTAAPPQALEGFLRKTGLTREQLTERDGILYAITEKPGRATTAVLAAAIPAIIRAFPWPKSMRWGAASTTTESLKWVRPLQGIVALFGDDIVPCEIAGIISGAATVGHRFHHPGIITIGNAADYAEKLRACHVIVDQDERRSIIAVGAQMAAQKAGLTLVRDEGLLIENAGLTEWPVPLLGRFDAAFLDVPPEVIQLTARVNQKYFVCHNAEGKLANAFICTANIDATDGGATIVEGNRKVLAARLSDARFFYDTDMKVPLEQQAEKLKKIVFHEKLGTVADKVDRVAKLARWLVEEGIVTGLNPVPAINAVTPAKAGVHNHDGSDGAATAATMDSRLRGNDDDVAELATLTERAARLCKADLVTGMVGEFPELQGLIGGYYATAQNEDPRIAAAIRDHYKPVGQGDDVPTDPVTVAVSLADKLDTIAGFFGINEKPTGSKDPFALRRAALGTIRLITINQLRLGFRKTLIQALSQHGTFWWNRLLAGARRIDVLSDVKMQAFISLASQHDVKTDGISGTSIEVALTNRLSGDDVPAAVFAFADMKQQEIVPFFGERLSVQQREAGVRHDLIDAVFALGGEDDLVRLLARVHALQAFVGTADGANLLAGYKRAANILKKEGYPTPTTTTVTPAKAGVHNHDGTDGAAPSATMDSRLRGNDGGDGASAGTSTPRHPGLDPGSRSPQSVEEAGPRLGGRGDGEGGDHNPLSYTPEKAETDLIAALDAAEPAAARAVAAEDFAAAMTALATLRAPIDAFFETVTVNDPDAAKRAARLALLARVRAAVHNVADFSKIEG